MGDKPRMCARCGLPIETRKPVPMCPDCRIADRWCAERMTA